MTASEFHDQVRSYCYRLNGSVTSYGRTPKHNKAVGGVIQSAHQFWLAADIVYDAPVPALTAVDCAVRLGLLMIRESDHDHLQPLNWSPGTTGGAV